MSVIGIPFALWRIANKWEDNNEMDRLEMDETDKEIAEVKKEIAGQYSDEENLKKWT